MDTWTQELTLDKDYQNKTGSSTNTRTQTPTRELDNKTQ